MIIAIAIAAVYIISAAVFLKLAMLRSGMNKMGSRSAVSGAWSRYFDEIQAGVDWLYSMQPERVEIASRDGLRLRGYFLPAEGAEATVILMHGYRSRELFDFSCVYRHWHERGFNILVPWQRAHGLSEGKLICFGVKERFDCLRWAEYIVERLGPDCKIILEGMSMGAATVLMAAGLELPGNVRGIIADCGFTSPYEIMEHTMRRWRIPPHPYLDAMRPLARLLGVPLGVSTEDALRRSSLPVLLIHGGDDHVVPPEMSRRNLAACGGRGELLEVPGAGHGLSYLVDRAACEAALTAFVQKILHSESGRQHA